MLKSSLNINAEKRDDFFHMSEIGFQYTFKISRILENKSFNGLSLILWEVRPDVRPGV